MFNTFLRIAGAHHAANLAHFARVGRFLVDPTSEPAPLQWASEEVPNLSAAREILARSLSDFDRDEMGFGASEPLAALLYRESAEEDGGELVEIWTLNSQNEPARILSTRREFLSAVEGDDLNDLGTEWHTVNEIPGSDEVQAINFPVHY